MTCRLRAIPASDCAMSLPRQQLMLSQLLLAAAVSKCRLLLCIEHTLRLIALNAHDSNSTD